ncbi:hypothetical protein GWI34_03695 [Actinomadura sp. DSM 109109]|nr:hypothetical protein [Actinomadura lepetitiana]
MKRVIAVVVAAVVCLPVPAFADGPGLRAVSLPFLWPRADEISRIASGAGEAWIAGGSSARGGPSTYVARFDGSAFQRVAIPDGAIGMLTTGPAGTFISHWDLDPDQRLLKRTGDAWTAVAVPGIDNVEDLQGLSATDAWAVGARQDLQLGSFPAVAHFDGTAWSSVPPPPVTGNEWFLKVVPIAADDVWAITQKHLAHWNGSAWVLIAPPAGLADLADLTVDASGAPWVAQEEAAQTSQAPYRYTGSEWEMVTVPDGAEVHDLAAVSAGVWGVGRQGDGPAAFNG